MPNSNPEKYIGMENYNHQGYLMKIIDYRKYSDVDIEFAEPYKCKLKTRVGSFLDGGIVNPYAPTICGVGIVGNKYSTVRDKQGNHCREYQTWSNMIKRCYDEEHRYKNPSYYDVDCSPEWFYYENFYDWIHEQSNFEQLQKIDNYAIDKDILVKGNRIYAPDRCTLVPKAVNNLLLKSDAIRGDYPIGVFYHKRNRKYIAACGGKKNNVYLGSFDTEIDAFNTYKTYKEKMIKKIAKKEFQKGTITEQCYNALMNYKVEITD